jgi:hypothetical protein
MTMQDMKIQKQNKSSLLSTDCYSIQSVGTQINKINIILSVGHNMSLKLLDIDITDIMTYALNNNKSKNENAVRNKPLS